MFASKDLEKSGNWRLNEVYHCKICSAAKPYYSFGNLGWAALHDNLVHNTELTQSRLEMYYEPMQGQDIIEALV